VLILSVDVQVAVAVGYVNCALLYALHE